jgi:two-component system nitrate/nitrite response regulator NarL
VLKTIEGGALVDAIASCVRGESVVSPELTGKLVTALRNANGAAPAAPADAIDTLSPRERDTLRCIARGASNKEIARTLNIAETTVKIHVQHILRKLCLSSRVQAAVYASERGLV